MNRKFRNTLLATFISSIVLIIAFYLYTFKNITELIDDQESVSHTNEVLYTLEQVASEIRDAENNQRGYLLTFDENFKKQYWGGYARTRNKYDEARRLTGDNVSQQMRLDTLVSLIDQRFKLLDKRFELGSLPFGDSRSVDLAVQGVMIMDKLDDLIDRMKSNEQGLLQYRMTNAREAADTTFIVSAIFTVLTVVIIIVSFAFTLNEFQRRSRTERMLEESVRNLQQSNENLEQFAYVASHDLQEPLRKIQAFGDLLKSESGDSLPKESSDYIDRMQNAALRMQTLINDLLNFSRASRNIGDFEQIQLREKIANVLSDLEITIRDSDASVDVDIPGTIMICGNRPQLSRLFQNIINNGIKFHNAGAKPVIKIVGKNYNFDKNIYDFNLNPEKEYIEVNITDNGIGFDEKYMDKIFTIFQRLNPKMDFKGTGIGLALCKKIVENHNGFITAKSEAGKGSTFIIILPTT